MKMKRIAGLVIAMALASVASAQTDTIYNHFMRKFMDMSKGYQVQDSTVEFGWRMVNQINTPMPDYSFSSSLNSKALKGKFVVFDFWATWCGGCRVLSHYMDSLMVKESDLYTIDNGIQLIGVNYKETSVKKARQYWKDKGYGFPNVDGKGVQECGEAVNAGHPTAIVVDDKGMIRYRVDGAGLHTAGKIMFALWALKFFPESGGQMTMATAQKFFDEGEPYKGLYVLYHLPLTREVEMLKFRHALPLMHWVGEELFDEMERKYRSSEDYQTIIRQMAEIIVEQRASSLYGKAWALLEDFCAHGRYGKEKYDDIVRLRSQLQCRYGLSLYRGGISMFGSYLNAQERKETDEQTIKKMEDALNSSKEEGRRALDL